MSKKKTADPGLDAVVDGLKESYGQGLGVPAPGPRFRPGHVRYGGRKPGTLNKRTRLAVEICESYDFHPCAMLVTVILTGKLPNPDGTFAEVDTAGRLDALKAICPFVMPRLQASATQISGPNDGPIELARANTELERAMASPGGVEIIQRAALLLSGQPDAPPARICPGPDDERARETEERRGV
jgi:hypothetical protein